MDGYAAAAVIATPDDSVAKALQPLFTSHVFRVYRNQDLLGAELGGVLKNIIAIATGMADGLGVGDNTRALVITRGLAEMSRMGEAMGGRPAHVHGPHRVWAT
jgi:glycerol-3-phosphate dehydrogenase (NAD(P)+)